GAGSRGGCVLRLTPGRRRRGVRDAAGGNRGACDRRACGAGWLARRALPLPCGERERDDQGMPDFGMFVVVAGPTSVLMAPVMSVISARGPGKPLTAGVTGAVGVAAGASGSCDGMGGTPSTAVAGAMVRGRAGGSGIRPCSDAMVASRISHWSGVVGVFGRSAVAGTTCTMR